MNIIKYRTKKVRMNNTETSLLIKHEHTTGLIVLIHSIKQWGPKL